MLISRIIGVGSPHGDDAIAWRLVEALQQQYLPNTEAVAVRDAADLLEKLADCRTAIVVDACQSGAVPGTIFRLEWPDRRVLGRKSTSSHALGVGDALALAARLGRLPPRLIVYGIEVANCRPGSSLNPAVEQALPDLTRRICSELNVKRGQGEQSNREQTASEQIDVDRMNVERTYAAQTGEDAAGRS
jgi:hydrogenase maturation protease